LPQAGYFWDWKKTNQCPFLASDWGLPSQHLSMLLVRSYRTFAPLPFRRKAVFFCGTILTIARTGRYPAGLVFEKPGLSSAPIEIGLQPPRLLSLSRILREIVPKKGKTVTKNIELYESARWC
jgi:hypothetical protein